MRKPFGPTNRSLVSLAGSVEKGLSSPENLKRFIEVMIPLLIDCWMEACPTQLAAPILSSLLEPGSEQLMVQVLSTIHLLWKLAKQNENPLQMVSKSLQP